MNRNMEQWLPEAEACEQERLLRDVKQNLPGCFLLGNIGDDRVTPVLFSAGAAGGMCLMVADYCVDGSVYHARWLGNHWDGSPFAHRMLYDTRYQELRFSLEERNSDHVVAASRGEAVVKGYIYFQVQTGAVEDQFTDVLIRFHKEAQRNSSYYCIAGYHALECDVQVFTKSDGFIVHAPDAPRAAIAAKE